MKNKIITLALVGVISISSLFSIGCSNKTVKEEANPKNPSEVSPMVEEKLAVIGKITEIKKYDDGIIIKVVGDANNDADYEQVYVRVHASTNIFKDNEDDLLEISDLKEDQMVKVYYDGTKLEDKAYYKGEELEYIDGQVSGLRVIIVE
ncbi:MAG: hypothetical protein ACRDD7_12670 [Peptostreptococcaceae bacterium]